MGVGIQVYDGDGVYRGPIIIGTDANWRKMGVMQHYRQRENDGNFKDRLFTYDCDSYYVSLTTPVNKIEIYGGLVAKNVEIIIETDFGDLMTALSTYRENKKPFNLVLKNLDEESLTKYLHCRTCRIKDMAELITCEEYQSKTVRFVIRARLLTPMTKEDDFPKN
jgi:hypothetical protein